MSLRRWLGTALCLALVHGTAQAEDAPLLTTPRDRANYAIGVSLIGNLRQQGLDIDLELVLRGMRDAHAGGKLLLNENELSLAVQQYQTAIREKRSLTRARAETENKQEGELFLAQNKTAPGVVTLPSGVQYKVVQAGTGRTPTDGDKLTVHLRGTLIDGVEFTDSRLIGKPTTITLESALPGLAQALRLMPEGSTWQVVLPSHLAYGERGKPGLVGPNETLIYEVELVSVR